MPITKSVLLLDISRLFWRARRRGPTGIDRVELAYAQHFLGAQHERPVCAVLHVLGFLIAVSHSGARRFVESVAARWEGAARSGRWSDCLALLWTYLDLLASLDLSGIRLRRRLRRSEAPLFLVVSHHHLARAGAIARLRRSLNVRTVCLIHDLLPLSFPEYFKRDWEKKYRRLALNLARLFDGAIVCSESTADAVRRGIEGVMAGRPTPTAQPSNLSIRVAALGVRTFPLRPAGMRGAEDRPFFAVLGTLEPRKNHLLLLNLWARLSEAMAAPPRLLVIGARGWENEQVLDMLERSRRLRGLVEEHNGLCDSEVGALLHAARALLLPSFAEGFGLPLGEALASGIPVICSDIGPFREVGRDAPEYLDPLNLPAWLAAVIDYSRPDSARRVAQLQRLAQWRAPCWADHFAAVAELLDQVAARSITIASQIQDAKPGSAARERALQTVKPLPPH
jgi:glycosyltransferase involved in cell wall biosynthesis